MFKSRLVFWMMILVSLSLLFACTKADDDTGFANHPPQLYVTGIYQSGGADGDSLTADYELVLVGQDSTGTAVYDTVYTDNFYQKVFWSGSDPDGDEILYRYGIDSENATLNQTVTQAGDTVLVEWTGTTSATVAFDAVNENQIHYFWVQAKDSRGAETAKVRRTLGKVGNFPPETRFSAAFYDVSDPFNPVAHVTGPAVKVTFGGYDLDKDIDGNAVGAVVGYEYSINNGEWVYTTSNDVILTDLPAGNINLKVRAKDNAGVVDPEPEEIIWEVRDGYKPLAKVPPLVPVLALSNIHYTLDLDGYTLDAQAQVAEEEMEYLLPQGSYYPYDPDGNNARWARVPFYDEETNTYSMFVYPGTSVHFLWEGSSGNVLVTNPDANDYYYYSEITGYEVALLTGIYEGDEPPADQIEERGPYTDRISLFNLGEVQYTFFVRSIDLAGTRSDWFKTHFKTVTPNVQNGRVLWVNETKPYNGAFPFFPDSTMIAEDYAEIFAAAGLTDYDIVHYDGRNPSTSDPQSFLPEELANYSTILWTNDNRSEHWLSENQKLLQEFLLLGGKLYLSGAGFIDDMAAVSEGNLDATRFVEEMLHIDFDASAAYASRQFAKADALDGGDYATVNIDPAKLHTAWAGYDYCQKLIPMEGAETIYTFDAADDNENYEGQSCGFRFISPDYSVVVCGFPLYFCKTDEAGALIQQVMQDFNIQ